MTTQAEKPRIEYPKAHYFHDELCVLKEEIDRLFTLIHVEREKARKSYLLSLSFPNEKQHLRNMGSSNNAVIQAMKDLTEQMIELEHTIIKPTL